MKQKNLHILFVLASVFSFAQVNIYSEVNTQEARVDIPINFTVVLEIVGEELIQESPVKLPDFTKFEYSFSSEQNTFINPIKKIRVNKIVYLFSLTPKHTGNLKIGSALVKVSGKMYKTEPINVLVKDNEKKPLVFNSTAKKIYIDLRSNEKEVYTDEPVVAVLKAYSQNISSFRNLKHAKLNYDKNLSVRNVNNFDKIIEDSEDNFSSKIIGMFVVIPKVSGVVNIPSAKVSNILNKNVLESNTLKLNVKKLPEGAPENFKNAVGKYDLKVEIIDKNKENFEINKALNISVKISGKGNLSSAIVPKILNSPYYKIFEPKIVNNSVASINGLNGDVEAQYVLIPKKNGEFKIKTEGFSYFDPEEKKYVNLGSQFISIKSVDAKDISKSKTTLDIVNDYTYTVLENVDTPVSKSYTLKITDRLSINWVYISSILILICVFIFLYFFKKKKIKRSNFKSISKPILTIAETEELIKNKKTFDLNSHILYLENKIEKGDYSKFFEDLEEIKLEMEQYIYGSTKMNLAEFVNRNLGTKESGKYQKLLRNINLIKYSPITSKVDIINVLKETEDIYSLVLNKLNNLNLKKLNFLD